MFGLANAQADGLEIGVGRDTRKQLFQPLKRVRLQLGEKGIHPPIIRDRSNRFAGLIFKADRIA
jgi:hypothetical protein